VRVQLELPNDVAAELAGPGDLVMKTLEEHLDCEVYLRGNVLTLDGDDDEVGMGRTVVRELSDLVRQGHEIAPGTIEAIAGALDRHESPSRILEDVVWRHRGQKVAPKTVNQKRYVDAIRSQTITVGIGPAGTGKSFLAVAMAVAALSRREVNRIVLTRPAVEAGERLGFLPGDIQAKVDPYLRPLFDALYDMLEPERVNQHLERGVIEIAPLAFMRGRAQPLGQPVLTPSGFRPIGSLRVGDLVIGSDGRPTPVLGVYPQGRKEVFRVRSQDGGSTLCCAEHLWFVTTPDDRKHGKAGRVLETREMVGRLRRNHQHRFELPMLSAPAQFEPREVPVDPYALGLLLGDGCLTTPTPALATMDREPVGALDTAAHRTGAISSDPATVGVPELGLAGTGSNTKCVPDPYLYNSPEVRLGVLQGLLDSDGVIHALHEGPIQFSTRSKQLAEDATFLVRSLGGVVQSKQLPDTYVLQIQLPDELEPFRLARKRDAYREHGAGRPMRFVESIEPVGEAETVCIQVAAADSLYVTDDFLVTHNTLNDAFIILDEAQNTSPEQIKMFLTRLGFNSKMVVTGDITQVDLPRDQASGLVVIGDILDEVEGIEFVRFGGEDVVRHKLVQRIVAAYNEYAEKQAPALRAPRRQQQS
jgi:phosphate starvation-inducible protein PhoH and related proteins